MNPISEMVNSILDEIFKYVYMGYVELLSIKNHIFSLNNKNDDGDHFIDEMLKNNNIVNSMISKISNQSLSKEDTMELLNKLSDEQFEILTKMDNLPDHVGDCVSDIQRHQKLSEFRIGQKLLGVENKLLSFDQNIKKRFKSLVNFVSNPLGFIKTIFTTVGRIISLMWKTIIPTLVSLAVTFFMTVLPVILMVLGIVILTVITLFLVWKHFGKYIKQFWDFIKEHVVNYIVMVWNILKEVVFWIWDTVKFVWGVLVDVYDFIDAIFSGDFTGAMKIVSRLMDRIVSYISSTFETIFNIFQHFGDFLSKLPIIGPVFKFLFDILMPFMRFFIEAFKWTYSFIKDGISVIWDNFKDAISLIKAIFSGDFSGAMVIVSNMFDRIVNFLVEKIISVLIILQDLGNSLMIPISWLWDSFKVAWDYYSKIISEVYDWIIGIFKIGWDSVKLVIDGIWASLQKVFNFITDIPGKLLGGVKDVVGGLGKALNPFNWFADGGIVTGPTQAVIGEAGPEAVLPLSGSGNNTLMGVLNSFFDTFLPFFKPLITFLWDNFKPYLPIMQSVMDAIYSVVYSIISGLSNLPQWLGGGIFADMLSKMTSPSGGGSGGKSVSAVDNAAFVSLISGEIGDMPMLSVVGKDKAQITTLDVSKGPIVNPTFKDVKDFVSGSSEKMEVPEFARSLQNGIESIHKGIETLSSKIDEVGKSIGNIGGDGGGSVQPANDTQFEMLKFISRSNFNGSRI
jgi:phage-related protein